MNREYSFKIKGEEPTINEINKKSLWTPMVIVQIYLSLIFVLFVVGPWPWPVKDELLLNFYLIMAQLLLLLGYFFSIRKRKITIISLGNFMISKKPYYNNLKIIKFLLILSFVTFIPNYITISGMNFNFSHFYESIINGILNPGDQYHEKLNFTNQTSLSPFVLLLIAVSAPFRFLFIPLCVVNWKRLPQIYKIGSIVFIILDTLSWVSIGTNKGIFDNVFIIAFSLLVKNYLDNVEFKKVIKNNKNKIIVGVFSFLLLSVAVIYLTNAIKSRLGFVNYYKSVVNISVDFDSPIMAIMPTFLKDTVIILGSYITQGYYGLSLAMQESFTTTYGFGNSWFLISLFERFTGNSSLAYNTYPFKIAGSGWDPYINWHSIYTWLASDFSFIGTLFLMIIIGYFFGEVWKSILFQKNVYAIGLFILLMIMFMYFPANNQVFAFINTFSAFWGLFILWVMTARIRV